MKKIILALIFICGFNATASEVSLGHCNVFIPDTFNLSIREDGQNLNFLKTEYIDYLGHKILNSEEVNIYKNMPIYDGLIKSASILFETNNKKYKGIVFKIPFDSDKDFGILVFSFEINGDWIEFIEVNGHDVSLYMNDCLSDEDTKRIEAIKTVRHETFNLSD